MTRPDRSSQAVTAHRAAPVAGGRLTRCLLKSGRLAPTVAALALALVSTGGDTRQLTVGVPHASPPQAATSSRARDSATPVCGYHVLNVYPHDPGAFTQGLVWDDGDLFEGTGLWGESTLRRVELETGLVLQVHHLDDSVFGEGITVQGNRLIQLTYLNHLGYIYDRDSFAVVGTFDYSTQGWGITTEGNRLVMTDGSSTLRFWHPETFDEIGRVEVWDEHGPVDRLNELELIDGRVWANVFLEERVARIDPVSGRVTSWINLEGLLGPDPLPGPLNGIAYDAAGGRLFVTGKLWPSLFEVELVDCHDLLILSDGFEWGNLSGWW
jgi:glutamine cyclotransferase